MEHQLNKIVIDGKNIAYKSNFSKINNVSITIVFLCGFMSDMEGTKSQYLESLCTKKKLGYLSFDYSGHGSSSGLITDGCISEWTHEAISVIEHCIKSPVVLVGSSMGGWIALLVALKMQERIVGILNIAGAIDFTELLMWDSFSEQERIDLIKNGLVETERGSCRYNITRKLVEDGRSNLLLSDKIEVNIPIFLLHGSRDDIVPVSMSLTLAAKLTSENVRVIISKNSDHRMSSEQDLKLLGESLIQLLEIA